MTEAGDEPIAIASNASRAVAPASSLESTAAPSSTGRGIVYCVLAMAVFATQDAMTKLLVADYPIPQFLMIRFVVFAAFVTAWIGVRGNLKSALRASRPVLQIGRGLMLVIDIALFCTALRYLGLAEFHAIYATAPLMTTALAAALLGEPVGWRRRLAVAIGFLGALLIIRPGFGVFQWAALIAIAATLTWALYIIMTRLVSLSDSFETNTLLTALVGAVCFTPFGLWYWQPPDARGWTLMIAISLTGVLGHMVFIRAAEHAPAVVLQPFIYLLLVGATIFGYLLFGELPDLLTVAGAAIVVGSGLYVAWREWVRRKEHAG
ncbi:MAG: DMT family transporter [Hyphomicrobiaceae bacterium]